MTQEREIRVSSGWTMLGVALAMIVVEGLGLWWFVHYCQTAVQLSTPVLVLGVAALVLLALLLLLLLAGLFTLEPNEAMLLILFGEYKGTTRESGFHWANPFYSKRKLSLRARNFESQKLKVNDKRGNPIEIAAVVVWRVSNPAQAAFDVDDFEDFVKTQSETAVRHLASEYAYDRGDGDPTEITLLSGQDEVAATMEKELQDRLAKAGVVIDEARIMHLAYAPEIAGAMLRRQQAEAVIAARQKIVHGAVSMVQMALSELQEKGVVSLDDERKAAMVSNLLVVLCGEVEAQPVINAGTLYTG
jgi:regulator of protease activity HflC (stomatin/prohibitin superfamily)